MQLTQAETEKLFDTVLDILENRVLDMLKTMRPAIRSTHAPRRKETSPARVLQGRYLGAMRALSPAARKRVQKLRAKKGTAAALKAAVAERKSVA